MARAQDVTLGPRKDETAATVDGDGPASVGSRLAELAGLAAGAMAADRPTLEAALARLTARHRAGHAIEQPAARLRESIQRSVSRREQRARSAPTPTFPEQLPISARREAIAQAIAGHQVVIVCGETGSGKTTQLPKICLALGRGAGGLIGCTQPRRIAARSVAARLAQELGTPLGTTVGYKVRFGDRTGPDTLIKVMTDGILLAETQGDRFLNAYDTLIVDEAHERSLNIDFLLGYLKALLPSRPDLKIIITSATIDPLRFSRHFGDAPVIEVSGRSFPVEIRYRPVNTDDDAGVERATEEALWQATDELLRLGPAGDILVFLPGEREIREAAEGLRRHAHPGTEILPLYARQSFEEQERIFRPGPSARRIILATNVAETSLTVPGIRHVIDTGVARIKRYSYRNKVDQLLVEPISQASANQRAGRCGRTAPGVCIRLYSEEDFRQRAPFTDAEILRTSLAGTILHMHALKLGDIARFPFVEPPLPRMIADGYQLLQELGAIDAQQRLTDIGRNLARLPVDPRLGRMLLAAQRLGALTEVLIITAALSVQDPRVRPAESAGSADERHRRFEHEPSDFMTYVRLWAFFDEAVKHQKSRRKLAQTCREHFLSYLRMREWREIHGQLHAVLGEMGLRLNTVPAPVESIHRALLAGLLGNLGVKTEEGAYAGARDIKFQIFPGSVLHKRRPKWIMAAELVDTGKLYGRLAAQIEPEWAEDAGAHLVRRTYFDPHWERRPAQVAAFERVTLYGLTLAARRRVHFGPIDPVKAREIFIRSALVAGDFDTRAPFLEHNRRLLEEVRDLEHKSRRQDVLVDDERMFAFFDARVPAGIHNGAAFEAWRREAEGREPQLLFLSKADVMRHEAEAVTPDLFPPSLSVGGAPCALRYRFEPGHPLDGVTLTVPLALLNQVDAARCEWLVPGLVREKIGELIRMLPKPVRRLCVPVPEFVTAALTHLPSGEGSLKEALAAFIRARTGTSIAAADWNDAALPAHLRMNVQVVDEAGQELAQGRDIAELKSKLGAAARLTFAREPALSLEREDIRTWDFGDLPQEIAFERGGTRLTGFPALADEKGVVSMRLFDTREAAELAMRGGVRRLMGLTLKDQVKQLERHFPDLARLAIQARAIEDADAFREDLLAMVADRAFIGDDELPRTAAAFAVLKDRARTRLPAVTQASARLVAQLFAEYQEIAGKLGRVPAPLSSDIREQLRHLVYPGFLRQTPWTHLEQLPRYLKAIVRRIEKYPGHAERDARQAAAVRELWQKYMARLEQHRKAGIVNPRLAEFRWMLEELRVSAFAQELRTPYPVSVKRLGKIWEEIRA